MTTVFDVFSETPYKFLEISQSTVRGDMVTEERRLMGIFKNKHGTVQSGNMESVDSTSTLHVHPSDFPEFSCDDFIGQGVEVGGVDYRIQGATAGTNFDTGVIEHYRLTLQQANFSRLEGAND